jgi:hypothetical protein
MGFERSMAPSFTQERRAARLSREACAEAGAARSSCGFAFSRSALPARSRGTSDALNFGMKRALESVGAAAQIGLHILLGPILHPRLSEQSFHDEPWARASGSVNGRFVF